MTELQKACKIVLDAYTKGDNFFTGKFDAKNGSVDFMYGICTVMENIAYQAGEEEANAFQKKWLKNFEKSVKSS